MSNTTITPYMNLVLPIPGLETGPQYAIDIDQAFTQIDQHSHIPGQGLPIPTAGININSDLSLNSLNLITARSSRYVNQVSPLSLGTDITCIYVSGGELYYNDLLGNQVQLTLGGAVDTSGSGNITGMGATTASVVYTAINHTFSFYSNTNTPAALLTGPLSIGTNTASPNTITLTTVNSLVSPYTLTMPASLPSQTAFVSTDNTGLQRNIPPDNVTTQIVSNQLVALFPSGMLTPYAGSAIPAGWLLCDGSAVSRTTYSTLFASIGVSYGYGDNSTTFNIPDCRGMFLRGVSGSSGNDPDASSRTAANTGGATGNNVGSLQGNTFTSHSHGVTDPGHAHTVQASYFGGPNQYVATNGDPSSYTSPTTTVTTGISINNNGGSETRPLNLYVNYLIKV